MAANEFGLGRIAAPDNNDFKFLMASSLPRETPSNTSKYWYANGWWGYQAKTSQCVGYSWAHWLEDGPVTQKGIAPIERPESIYYAAQKIDEWEGENYEGTSVRAGAKVLQDLGYIESYTWAWDLDTIINALLTTGPVVVGTYWYDKMFEPNSKGLITIGGQVAGGHAYLLNGVNTKTRLIRLKNSWGNGKNGNIWGIKGHGYISFDDMARLIHEQGEACLPVEIKK